MPEEVATPSTTTEATETTETQGAQAAATGASPQATAGLAQEKPAAAQDTAQAGEGFDWTKALESVPPEQLRKHPRIAGIVGSELQRATEANRAKWEADQKDRADQEAEERLRRLAEEDPVQFSQQYLTEKQAEKARRDLADLRSKTEGEIGRVLGQSLQEIPEWKELSAEDFDTISKAVAEKPEQALGAFAATAVQTVATKIAAKMLADWKAKELGKEREAIRQEEAAKLLKREKSPDMTKPAGAPAKPSLAAIPDDAEFNRRYEEELHKRTLSRYR
ncbi:MAG: hypothetical protein M0Z94_19735 [Dehalococcoidales bacterium]|nr:hypothetical protein [Dehalococcoidales bacterium]